MKKLLSLFAAMGLIAGSTSMLLSCDKKQNPKPIPEPPKPPTKKTIDLKEVIKNNYLGVINYKTIDLILTAVKDNNLDLDVQDVEVKDIKDNSALIQSKLNSNKYHGSIEVEFSLEGNLEKLAKNKIICDYCYDHIGKIEEKILRSFIYANWPIKPKDSCGVLGFWYSEEAEKIVNKLTATYKQPGENENILKVLIKPKPWASEYSGSVIVNFFKFSDNRCNPNHPDRRHLSFIYESPLSKIGKVENPTPENILLTLEQCKTYESSITGGKPIDISKITVRIADNKLSAFIEPKPGISEYNGWARIWFAYSGWNS